MNQKRPRLYVVDAFRPMQTHNTEERAADDAREERKAATVLEAEPDRPDTAGMSDVTRHEMTAALAASEARVATVMEAMRANAAEVRADLRENNSMLRAQSEMLKAQAVEASANAQRFYADARSLLAESRASLAEIKLAGEQSKTVMMGMGYRVITWTLATLLAVGSVGVGAYKAFSKGSSDSVTTSVPEPESKRPVDPKTAAGEVLAPDATKPR